MSGDPSPDSHALHVLTLTPFYPTVGDDASGCFIAEPLESLARLGVKNSVFVAMPFYRKQEAFHSQSPVASGVRYLSIPGGWGLASAGGLLFSSLIVRARELHRASPVDLIHAHGPLPCGHAARFLSRELGVPFVVSVHGLDAYSTRQVSGMPGEWCRRISKLVFESAKRVVCVSEHVRESVIQGCARCETSVAYNGADPQLFSPPQDDATKSPKIVSVGNLIRIKGHANLIQAVAALRADYPSLSCEIIGDGPEREGLAMLARNLGIEQRVVIAGRKSRQEVAKALRSASLFVLPSTYEALGCVYLEAMASGIPPIGCVGQGIEEIIRHGSNGWLVPPDNVDELVTALRTLLGHSALREHVGAVARETILQSLTTDHQASRLLRLYHECLV